jgi:hypothetical protein
MTAKYHYQSTYYLNGHRTETNIEQLSRFYYILFNR